MPIEIRELVIRVVVEPHAEATPQGASAEPHDHDALVQACVDQTLRILRRMRER